MDASSGWATERGTLPALASRERDRGRERGDLTRDCVHEREGELGKSSKQRREEENENRSCFPLGFQPDLERTKNGGKSASFLFVFLSFQTNPPKKTLKNTSFFPFSLLFSLRKHYVNVITLRVF